MSDVNIKADAGHAVSVDFSYHNEPITLQRDGNHSNSTGDYIFWTDNSQGTLNRAFFNGSCPDDNCVFFSDLESPEGRFCNIPEVCLAGSTWQRLFQLKNVAVSSTNQRPCSSARIIEESSTQTAAITYIQCRHIRRAEVVLPRVHTTTTSSTPVSTTVLNTEWLY